MATSFRPRAAQGRPAQHRYRHRSRHRGRWSKRVSSHLAAALVVFCLAQIAIVAKMGGSLLLHLGIVVAIAIFGIAARGLERRWEALERSGLSRHALGPRYRADVMLLWLTVAAGALLWVPIAVVERMLLA